MPLIELEFRRRFRPGGPRGRSPTGRAFRSIANEDGHEDNPDMTDDKIAYAIKVMNDHGIILSGDALTLGIGSMTDARWSRLCKSMADVGVLPAGVDPAKACSLEFVNKGLGEA
jgi:NitT/TauT family transport system substrate-binding protein